MLARAHRVRSGTDFRDTIRRGRKAAVPTAIVYGRAGNCHEPVRFGIVVSKAVGSAVTRNLVKRRIRAICAGASADLPAGTTVVIRALPAAAEVDWDTLREQMIDGFRRAVAA